MTKEEYLALVTRLTEQQYNCISGSTANDQAWIPAISPAKEKMKSREDHNGLLNLSNIKKDKVIEFLTLNKYFNLKVEDFLVKISRYSYDSKEKKTTLDLSIYEEKTINQGSIKSKILNKVDLIKDPRFETRPWLKYFNSLKMAKNIPIEEMGNIVRWLQAISKLAAFT